MDSLDQTQTSSLRELDLKASRPSSRIIRADEVRFWRSGAEYLEFARQALEEARNQIPQIVAEARARGYREGREEGTKSVLDLMGQLNNNAQAYYTRLNEQIVGLVLRIVGDLVGDMTTAASVSATVLKALKTLDLGSEFTLYVAPESYDEVARVLAATLDATTQSKLLLRQDKNLAPSGCRLVSEFGILDLSIEKQLEILASSLRAAGVGIQA